MSDARYVTLALRRVGTTAAYGPYATYAAAVDICALLLQADPTVDTAWPMALTPVEAQPLTGEATYPNHGVTALPEALAGTLTRHACASPAETVSVVLVVICGGSPAMAVTIGPFDCATDVNTWLADREHTQEDARYRARWILLPLRHLTLRPKTASHTAASGPGPEACPDGSAS